MTARKLIFIFLIFGVDSCRQKDLKHTVNPVAVKLANEATSLVSFIDNTDSCKKAITLLDSATAIDSNYFLGYQNKLMFLTQLKQYTKAILTNNNLIRIKPFAHEIYLTSGLLYMKMSDTLTSRNYFQKSLTICNNALDTMNVNNKNYVMLVSDKAFNLIMLGENKKLNELLQSLSAREIDVELKKNILSMMESLNKN